MYLSTAKIGPKTQSASSDWGELSLTGGCGHIGGELSVGWVGLTGAGSAGVP